MVSMAKTDLFQTEEVRRMSRKPIWIIVAAAIVGVFFLSQVGYAGRGCKNKTGEPGYFPDQIVSSGGLDREYNLYVHPRYKHNRPTPLVILLHGLSWTPEMTMQYTNLAAFADAFKFILVAPKGIGLAWNFSSGSADVAFVEDMIEAVSEDYCIHPKRIFATGTSMGGAMTQRLACDLSDLIAAIAPVACPNPWVVWGDICEPERPVPMIQFNGTGDAAIPFEGGTNPFSGIEMPPVPEMFGAWAELYECSGETEVVYEKGEVTCIEYAGCEDEATLRHCIVEGGGHNWPGAVDLCVTLPGLCWLWGHTTEDIDASREIWKFFAEHGMNDED
jgi:polyhydroxybutyrate depolymerase